MGTIYFLQASSGGPVKIGFTSGKVRTRQRAAQTFHPEALVVIAEGPGSLATEQRLHSHFSRVRARDASEWFHPIPELLALVEAVCDGIPLDAYVEACG